MGVRVIVGLKPGADWERVSRSLVESGAEEVNPPRVAMPNVLTATFPEGFDAGEAVARANRLREVAYAEPDVFRTTLDLTD